MAKRSYSNGRQYAEDTKVPVGKSQANIRKLVSDKGATSFALIEDEGRAIVSFKMAGFVLQFGITFPAEATDQEGRRLWRCLELTIKAKLTAAEAGVESFQEAFLANIVAADGRTVGASVIPQLDEGKAVKLLPARI